MEATVTLTGEELDALDAMFEVLIDNGVYMLLRAPEIVKVHRRIFKKVQVARAGAACSPTDTAAECRQKHKKERAS